MRSRPIRHFLTLRDLGSGEFRALLQRAHELKRDFKSGHRQTTATGKVLAMVFEKASTRTRVSFETAMAHLGGHAVFLSPRDTQLGRGEPLEDTARVLSQMVDGIMLRTHAHARLEQFTAAASVPVINGLTDRHHPCQLLADMQTYLELRGDIAGRKVAWIGDGNNMCNSYLEASMLLDFQLHVACPPAHRPDAGLVAAAGRRVSISADPAAAVAGADLVVTDVWASMGQEQEAAARKAEFARFMVDEALIARADPGAVFLHCLPAHRGEEVSAGVIDGPQSAVWEEAGNRLHAQKALLEFLMA